MVPGSLLVESALVYRTVLLRGSLIVSGMGKEDVTDVGCPFTPHSTDRSLQGVWAVCDHTAACGSVCPAPLLVFLSLKYPSGHCLLWELST